MQETVIPVLLHKTVVISQLIDVMDEDELAEYKQPLLDVATDSINANFVADQPNVQLKFRIHGVRLYATLCDHFDGAEMRESIISIFPLLM